MRIKVNKFPIFSIPNPIIAAAKVPPKTIKIGRGGNKALSEPPSKVKAPKIENIPSNNPLMELIFLIISNPKEIWEEPLPPFHKSFQELYSAFQDRHKVPLNRRRLYLTSVQSG